MPFNLGIGLGLGNGGGVTVPYVVSNAEATALIARMTVPPSEARKALIDNLIGSLKSAGVWTKLDCLYVMAAHDAQAARLNWKSSSFTLTAVNSPGFTTDSGYIGNGTSSLLDSGYDPTTAAGGFVQDSAHMGLWYADDAAITTQAPIGNLGATLRPRVATADGIVVRLNGASTLTLTGMPTSAQYHFAVNRTLAASFDVWSAGVKRLAAQAATSVAVTSLSFTLLARQIAAASYQYDNHRYSVAHWGSGLTDAENLALYNALRAYMTALGAP